MDNETDKPKLGGMRGFGLAHLICCGGLVLVAFGAFTGIGAWLRDGGLTWLLLAAVLGVGGWFLLRRWSKPRRAEQRTSGLAGPDSQP